MTKVEATVVKLALIGGFITGLSATLAENDGRKDVGFKHGEYLRGFSNALFDGDLVLLTKEEYKELKNDGS